MATSKIPSMHSEILHYIPCNYQLFAGSLSNTAKTITSYAGRKISDYALIIIMVYRNSIVRGTLLVPVSVLKTMRLNITEVDSINTQRWYECGYVSDTSITV